MLLQLAACARLLLLAIIIVCLLLHHLCQAFVLQQQQAAATTKMATTTTEAATDTFLLSELQKPFPDATGYEILQTIEQSNAIGYKLRVQRKDDKTNVFLKQVRASDYVAGKKDWTDLRRTLLYTRTEVRFYKEMLPVLQQALPDAKLTPTVHYADYDLSGWIPDDEIAATPADKTIDKDALPNAEQKVGVVILECINDNDYFQDSPLTVEQCQACLRAAATLHAAAWQNQSLLQLAEQRLSKASFHLDMRNPKELAAVEQTWSDFAVAFAEPMKEAGLIGKNWDALGQRIARVAQYVSDQVSPSPNDPFATLIHGDYKALNVFIPTRDMSNNNALLVDFASCGVGLGMSDLAMHLRHAVVPETLDTDQGEEKLVRYYWEYLTTQQQYNDYSWQAAWRHYRYAVVDYFRFFLARMYKGATPEIMAKKADNKNVNLINRNVPASMAFLKSVEGYLQFVETEYNQQCAAAKK